MLKYKNKVITAIAIIAVLSAAWFYGGNYNMPSAAPQIPIAIAEAPAIANSAEGIGAASFSDEASPAQIRENIGSQDEDDDGNELAKDYEENLQYGEHDDTVSYEAYKDEELVDEVTPQDADLEVDKYTLSEDEYEDNEVTSQDLEPSPHEEPDTADSQDLIASDGSFTVTLSVRVDTILDNMNLLDVEKHELIPLDGVIFPATVVVAYEGESVFNVLQREMRRNGIHMAFRNVPIFGSAYVMGINNIFEFDVGELSGWMYRVNGWFPNFGSSLYILSPGDVIEWVYTVDLGRDVGDIWEGW